MSNIPNRPLCTYCGSDADVEDHVIPLAFLEDNVKKRTPRKSNPEVYWVTASCATCNTLAGSAVFFSIPEKAEYILAQYKRKYKKLLSLPRWGEEELSGLGYVLETMIREKSLVQRVLLKKLKTLAYVASFSQEYQRPEWVEQQMFRWKHCQDDFIPIYKYAEKHGISKQTVYRLIREGRFDQDDLREVKKTNTRKEIRENCQPITR